MENKLQLEVSAMHSITRSYSKKINLSNYVKSKDYESLDFFSSHNEQVPVGTPQEEIDKLSSRLFELSRLDVEIAATSAINELKKAAGLTVEPSGKEREAIADIIAAYEVSITEDDVKKASAMVVARKNKLNEVQLDFLRTIGNKASARALN
jgi:hypothetical protein